MSGGSKPLSILLRNELMCTSTTLLMLSKWMSQTCSMISALVSGRSALPHQDLEQRVLLGLQLDRRSRATHLSADGVHLEVRHAQDALARRAAPEQRTEPRREFSERERLRHVVVRPGVQPGDALFERVFGRENKHRQRRPSAPGCHAAPGTRIGQAASDRARRRRSRWRAPGRPPPRRRCKRVHGVAFLLEAGLDETRDLPIVLNHEDAHRPLHETLTAPFIDGRNASRAEGTPAIGAAAAAARTAGMASTGTGRIPPPQRSPARCPTRTRSGRRSECSSFGCRA